MVWLRLAATAASGVAILTGSPHWHAVAWVLHVAVVVQGIWPGRKQ